MSWSTTYEAVLSFSSRALPVLAQSILCVPVIQYVVSVDALSMSASLGCPVAFAGDGNKESRVCSSSARAAGIVIIDTDGIVTVCS